jgi:PAS domain S-box-containing protein
VKNTSQPEATRAGHGIRETGPVESRSMWRFFRNTWCRVGSWTRANTFAPSWLPKHLRRPLFSYLVAVLLEGVAVTLTMLLITGLPEFSVVGLLVILVVGLVALHWGSGPSVMATLVGAVLLEFFVFRPQFSWSLATATEYVSVVLILAVGFLISLAVGQVAAARHQADQARHEAEARADQLHTIFDTLVEGVFVYDKEGHIIEHNAASRAQLGIDYMPDSISWSNTEWTTHLVPRDAQGQPLPLEQTAPSRILRGEVFTGEAARDERIRTLDGREIFVSITGAPIRNRQGQITGAVLVGRDVTERHRLEEEVAAGARELEAVIDSITDAVMVCDAAGHPLRFNRAGLALQNLFTPPDDLQRSLLERASEKIVCDLDEHPLPPEQYPAARVLRGEVLSGADSADVMVRALEGQPLYLNMSGSPLRDAAGKQVGAVMVGRNVTERRRLEQEATARARQLEATIEAMTEGVGIYDPQGHSLLTNRAGKKILGIEANPTFFTSRPHAERIALVHTRDKQGHPFPPERSPLSRALRGEIVSDAESEDMIITALDGQERYLSATAAPIWDAHGQLAGAVFVYRDVTERRRLEQRTQQALNALIQVAHTLVAAPVEQPTLPENIPPQLVEFTREVLGQEQVTLVSLDPETRTLHPLAAFGLTPEQEARWRSVTEGTRRGNWFGPEVGRQLNAGEVVQVDFSHPVLEEAPHILGGRRHLLAPLLVGQRLLGYLTVGRANTLPDFTVQEKELLGAVARLCALVLEREQLLREREETRAHMLALEEAGKRMDSFLNIASHELKTPLTPLRLVLEILKRRVERLSRREPETISHIFPQFQENLALVEAQFRRLERLVDDLLDVSRIQAGQLELRLESVDLVPIVRLAVKAQQEAKPSRCIQVQLCAPEHLLLRADARRIGQVITNYLTNALKYSPEDQPVEVGLEAQEQSARVWVRDQGPGIPIAEQEHIWERFYRVPGVEVQSGSGVGLGMGLYISRIIIERHAGQVGVQSEPGAGATFWFTLPLEPQDKSAQANPGSVSGTETLRT